MRRSYHNRGPTVLVLIQDMQSTSLEHYLVCVMVGYQSRSFPGVEMADEVWTPTFELDEGPLD